MKQSLTHEPAVLTFNECVKEAYYSILKQTKSLLATLEREEMRYTLEREDKSAYQVGTVLHEIINPLIYLRLECHSGNVLAIHFGFEQVHSMNQYSELTSCFIRHIYLYTSKDHTPINIEKAVRTDWLIMTCSECYEYTEERNKHHTFKLIKYKPASIRRKHLQAVA